jgi:hypothetical protein
VFFLGGLDTMVSSNGDRHMVFENVINKLVRDTLRDIPFFSEFYSHTLFVNVAEEDARKLYHVLSEYCGLGHVQITKITHGEYAYDFV